MTDYVAGKDKSIGLTTMVVLVVLCASWGLQQVAIKVANHGISPLLQSAIRSAGGTILVWVWMVARRELILERDGTLWFGFAAGILFAGEFLLVYWGLEFTNASRSVIFLYTSPFFVAIGVKLFIPGERLGKIQVAGLCCAFVGIVFAFNSSLSDPTYQTLIGDCMIILAAVFWGATTVLIKASPLSKIKHSKTLLYQLTISAVVLFLGSLAKSEPGFILITPLVVACLAYQIVWVAFITYLVWFWLVKNYPPSRLASFTFLTPLFGVLAGNLFLDEPITSKLLLALVFVGTGIYLVNRPIGNQDLKS